MGDGGVKAPRKSGRPHGSKGKVVTDLRPVVARMTVRVLNSAKNRRKIEEHIDGLPADEQIAFIMSLAKLGLAASPKTTESLHEGVSIVLQIDGARRGDADRIDRHPTIVLPESDPSVVDPTSLKLPESTTRRLPGGSAACSPGLRGGSRPEPVPVAVEPDDPVPRNSMGYSFTVPSSTPSLPREWAVPMDKLLGGDD